MSEYIPAKLRRAVKSRANNVCEYCRNQESFHGQSFSIEHIEPKIAGGETVSENLAYSCQGCNSHKGSRTKAKDSLTGKIVGLFNPRKTTWNEHFEWNEDCSEIVGITTTGRATVSALRLNRQNLVNLRRVLFAAGEHPPD